MFAYQRSQFLDIELKLDLETELSEYSSCNIICKSSPVISKIGKPEGVFLWQTEHLKKTG